MTVRELIQKLEKFNPDKQVVVDLDKVEEGRVIVHGIEDAEEDFEVHLIYFEGPGSEDQDDAN